jgi:hypothetical protein
MRIVEENKRKRIVETLEEAYSFFDEWHQNSEAS